MATNMQKVTAQETYVMDLPEWLVVMDIIKYGDTIRYFVKKLPKRKSV